MDTIYLENFFFGYTGNFDHDIAVIVLPIKIEISVAVSPVCIDWNNKYSDLIPNGTSGKVICSVLDIHTEI